MFLSDVATAAKQVFILYVLVLLGFICDRTKIYTEKAARLTNDLLFYIVTPAIIIQSFSSVEMSGENVRGMLMSFLGGTILHVVAIVICIPFWRRTDKICRAYISMRRYTEMSAIWHCRSPRQSSEPRACSFARAC